VNLGFRGSRGDTRTLPPSYIYFRIFPCAERSRIHAQILEIDLHSFKETKLRTILLIILILLLLGALPTWPYSTGWGYYPSGGLGLVLLIVVVLVLAKKL
jgi:hypothetical protein